MDNKALKTLLKTLRESGVTQYTTPELSLTIELPSLSQAPSVQEVAQQILDGTNDDLTGDSLLFYSAPQEMPKADQ